MPPRPKFPRWLATWCWLLFLLNTLLIAASMLVALDSYGLSDLLEHVHAWAFPLAIGVSVMTAAACTLLSIYGFGRRAAFFCASLGEAEKAEKGRIHRFACDGFQVTLQSAVETLDGSVQTYAGWHPRPYEEAPISHLTFRIDRFFELLHAERHVVRAMAGQLAGVLGGSAAASILAWGRLAQALAA